MPATIDIPELGTLELPEGTTDEQASVIGRDVYTRQVHLPRLKKEITANLQEAQDKTIESGAYKVGEYAARAVDIFGSIKWLGDVTAGFATDFIQGRVLPTPSRGILPNLSSTGAALAQEPDTSVNAKLTPIQEGLVEGARSTPTVVAGIALSSAGVPPPLAFGGVMGGTTLSSTGSYEEAGKSAVVGAIIPGVSSAVKQFAGRALAGAVNRGIISAENVTAQKLIEASAEFAGITAFLEALNIPSYMEMGPGERSDAFAKSLASQLAFLPMSLMGLRGGRPSVTQEMLAKDKPIPTYTPLPRDEVPLAPLLLTEGAPAPRGPIITPPPPIKLSGISQAEVALRESAILLRQTVPEPVKRPAQTGEIPILGQRPVTIEQELILPEKFMQAEAARDALIAEQAKVTVDFSDAVGSLDFTGMEAAKQQLLGIYGNLHENVELRKSLSEQLEGDYPPTAEQLGTFQSRAAVPELSDVTKSPDPSKLGAADQPESTRLRAGRAVQPGEQVYPEPPVGVVPPESLRSEFVPEADVPEYPPKRPPAGAPEGEQRSGIISGSNLERWADRVNAEDPRAKTRLTFDILDVRRVTAAAVKGAAMLERGIRDFASWSKAMIDEFGEGIRPHLKDLFSRASNYHERRQSPFVLSGPELVTDPKRTGFKDTTQPVDSNQLWNWLKNNLTPAEVRVYEDAGVDKLITGRGKISPEEAAVIMVESGPQVKVESYGMEGKVSEAAQTHADLTHGWYDDLDYEVRNSVDRAVREAKRNGKDNNADYNSWVNQAVEDYKEKLGGRPYNDFRNRLEKFVDASVKVLEEPKDTSPRATPAYGGERGVSSVNPEEVKKYGGESFRVDVVIPVGKVGDNYQKFLEESGMTHGDDAIKFFERNRHTGKVLFPAERGIHESFDNTLVWTWNHVLTYDFLKAKASHVIEQFGLKPGEKILVMDEEQSRWGQSVKKAKDKLAKSAAPEGLEGTRGIADTDHPLLRDYNRLGLKATIARVKEMNKSLPEGQKIKRVVVVDAETAMMTEGQDAHARPPRSPFAYQTKETAIEEAGRDGYKPEDVNIQTVPGQGYIWQAKVGRVSQEPGMRLNYDPAVRIVNKKGKSLSDLRFPTEEDAHSYAQSRHGLGLKKPSTYPKDWKGPREEVPYELVRGDLHSIMEELTGVKGERVELGEHKNAINTRATGTRAQMEDNGVGHEYYRDNLIFKNPDGTPKTSASGMSYSIEKVPSQKPSLFDRDRPESRAARREPSEGGIISGTDLEKWADRVLGEDPRSKVRMGDPLDVRRVAAAAVKGAALLERGIRDFAAWSAEMIKQHGPWIEKSLPDLFKKSNKYLEVKQAQQAQDKSADPDSFVPPVQAKSQLVTEFTDPTKAEKKKSSRMPYGDRMNTAMDAVSAPENKGKYIPAIKTADGEIITANDHSQAWEKMRKEGKKPAASKVMGYVDHDGKFLTLKDIAALESKEPVETTKAGEGETETVTEPATTPVTKEGGDPPSETQTQTQGQEVLGKKPLRPLGEIYSEPFAERIRRLGGVVADKVAKDTQGIIDNAKRLYGELSADWLDKAKIASGKAFRGGTTWMNGIDNIKNIAGVVNARAAISRLFTALETFNKTGNWDHVPTAARPLAKMLYDANLAMGRLANQGNPIGAVDSVKRLVTPWGTDVLKRGGGRAWEALVNGHAEANNKTVAFTENFFRRWKAELDKPTPDSTALDKISKEYVASFPNAVTHLKPILGWHEFLQSSPFHYLEQSGQRIANTVAFQQVYPPGSGKLNQTRTAIQAEVKTDAGMKEFDDMTRALRGYPTDVWWTIAPDTITGAASRAIGMALRPIKSLLLTQSLATNTGETLSGGASIFFGYGRAFKAMYVSKQLRQQMIRTGQINKAIRDFSFSPSQPLQSLSKIGANLISRTFLNDFANEVQEFASARAAKIVADEIRTGTLPASDVPLIENTLRMMGFTKEQSKAAVAGNAPDVINQFETKAAEALSSGNQILAEKSRLGSSRTFNLLFWFHNYPMLKFRQGRSIMNNVIEDARSGDWKGAGSNAKLMGRFLGGTALSGAITAGVLALVKEGLYGVGIRKQEAQDDFGRFVMDSFLMGMGGPLMAWSKIAEETGSVDQLMDNATQAGLDAISPISIARNMGRAVTSVGEYEGMDAFEKIGKFLESKTPGTRPFKAGLAAVGLIQYNPKLDAAIGAYYRWSRRNIGVDKTEIRRFNDDRVKVRGYAKQVVRAIKDGKDFGDPLVKSILAAAKTTTDNPYDSAARSIRGKQILGMSVSDDGKIHGKLSAEELGALRKHIGDDPVNRIMAYDTMLDQVADLVAGMKVKE